MYESNETSTSNAPLLEYGRADPIGRRVRRWVPRIGIGAILAMAALAAAIMWLARDHEVWAVAHEFARDPSARFDLAVSPDGARVAAAVGQAVDVWELASGRRPMRVELGERVRGVRYAPGGAARMLVERADHSFRLIDALTGTEVARVGERSPAGAKFSPDGRRLLTWSGVAATLWDAESGRRVVELCGPGTPHPIAVVSEPRFTDDSRRASIWDTQTVRGPITVRAEDGEFLVREHRYSRELVEAASRDGRRIAYQEGGGLYRLSGPADGGGFGAGGRAVVIGGSPGTYGVTLSADGAYAATIADAGLQLWDAASGRELASTRVSRDIGEIRFLSGGPGPRRLCAATGGGLVVWRLEGTSLTPVLRQPGSWGQGGRPVLSDDESRAVTFTGIGEGARGDLWDARDGSWLGGLRVREGFEDARFSGNDTLVVGTKRGISVYRARRPVELWGYLALPAAWVTVGIGAVAVWWIGRDLRRWYSPAGGR
jgi:hypothetical protein